MGDILFLAHRVPYPPDSGDKIRGISVNAVIGERVQSPLKEAFDKSPPAILAAP